MYLICVILICVCILCRSAGSNGVNGNVKNIGFHTLECMVQKMRWVGHLIKAMKHTVNN